MSENQLSWTALIVSRACDQCGGVFQVVAVNAWAIICWVFGHSPVRHTGPFMGPMKCRTCGVRL